MFPFFFFFFLNLICYIKIKTGGLAFPMATNYPTNALICGWINHSPSTY